MIAALGRGDLTLVALIVAVAACAQMVSGFGFALMAVPLMGLAIDLKTAVVVSTICGTASNTYQAVTDREHRDGRMVRVLVVASFIGMPFGVFILDRVGVDTLRIVIGVFVLLALVAVMSDRQPREFGGQAIEVAAGILSGVLATSTSTNGPPLVLLLRARGLTPAVFRATINTVFCVVAVVSIAAFAIAGRISSEVLVGSLVALPGLVIGVVVGGRLRGLLTDTIFWRLVAVLLAATATSSIAAGITG